MEEYLKFAKEIAEYAKKVMNKYFIENNQSSYKEDNTIVTVADKDINDYLIERVKEKYPTHCVYGEEKTFGKSNIAWVCDPIDGTAMYARHIPTAVFSLALVINGEPVVGVVYDPFTDNLYSAIKGQGAYKNNKRINVNNKKLDGMKTIIHYDIWPTAEYDIIDCIKAINKKTYTVSIGSVIRASLCVAEGNFNAVIFPGTKGKNCDIAAVKVIVEEAGGKVTDLFGDEQSYAKDINGALITNKINHEELIEIIESTVK